MLALCFVNVLVGCLVWILVLGLAGKSCGVHMLVRFPLANFVMAGLCCVHVWFGVCFWFAGWFVFCQFVGWVSGWDFGLGLAGKSCGVHILVGFPLASFVVVGLGCVHAWFCLCFP